MYPNTKRLLRTVIAIHAMILAAVFFYAPQAATAHAAMPNDSCRIVGQRANGHPVFNDTALCRTRGWTITPRLVVGPRAVLLFSTLPRCSEEDGSDEPLPCSWNFPGGVDGNGSGLSYYITWPTRSKTGKVINDGYHYVWPTAPVKPWVHVTSAMADALAEGYSGNLPWMRCIYNTHTLSVRCPDGLFLR